MGQETAMVIVTAVGLAVAILFLIGQPRLRLARLERGAVSALGMLLAVAGIATPARADFGGCCKLPDGTCKSTTRVQCTGPIGGVGGLGGDYVCDEVCLTGKACIKGRSRYTCAGGERAGKGCEDDANCPGSTCAGKKFTCGGGADGGLCVTKDDCPQGVACSEDGAVPFPKAAAAPTSAVVLGDWASVPAAAETCQLCEQNKPLCSLVASRSGPPAEIDIRVQDTCSGLGEIDVLVEENASVDTPAFDLGANEPVVVTATKLDQTRSSRVELRVTDMAGNATLCDPVLAEIRVPEGRGRTRASFTDIPSAERFVTILNGAPGIRRVQILINGQRVENLQLRGAEVRTVDVGPAMMVAQNIVTLIVNGKPGGSALVIIADSPGVESQGQGSTYVPPVSWDEAPCEPGQNRRWGR